MSAKSVNLKQGLKEKFGAREPQKKAENPPPSEPPFRPDHSRRPDNGDKSQYYLPCDTLSLVKPLLGSTQQRLDNFALLLNKCAYYAPDRKDRKKGQFILYRKKEYQIRPNFEKIPLKELRRRHKTAITSLNLEIAEIPLKVDWRLIVGLGNESVYETSMTLHHIYGIPYIPGQAVKGVLRSWIILTEFNAKESDALLDHGFCDLFGCPAESGYKEARQGQMIFFDAFPTALAEKSIQVDIMNPHYGPYYAEGKPPADYHNPVPVNFLTVQNTTFEFYVGIKQNNKDACFQGKRLLAVVQEALPQALGEHGLGAKTAVGYGYLSK